MKFKMIGYHFKRNSLHKVGRVSSFALGKTKIIDHTTGADTKCEPASLQRKLTVLEPQGENSKLKGHLFGVLFVWLPLLGNEGKNNWVLFLPKFSLRSKEYKKLSLDNALDDYAIRAAPKVEPNLLKIDGLRPTQEVV